MALITGQPENLPTTNALDNQSVQGALIEAAFVKFSGNSATALDAPPELDEARTYIVKGTCTAVHREIRRDNEERTTVTITIDSLYEQGKVPIVDEAQGSLYAVEDEDGAGDE